MATWTMPMYTAASPGNLLPKFSGPAEGGTIARRASLLQATTGAADKSVDAAGKACDLAPRARAGEAATTPPRRPRCTCRLSCVAGADREANAAPAAPSIASPVRTAAPTAAARREISMMTHLLSFVMAVHDRSWPCQPRPGWLSLVRIGPGRRSGTAVRQMAPIG